MKSSIRNLRNNIKVVMSAVGRGESVVITNHGKPQAKIVPLKPSQSQEKEDIFGMWADYPDQRPVTEIIKTWRKGRFENAD